MEKLTERQHPMLDGVIRDLHLRFRSTFSHEMIEALVVDDFCRRAANATVTCWLVLGTERACIERLDALARVATKVPTAAPAGRSMVSLTAGT